MKKRMVSMLLAFLMVAGMFFTGSQQPVKAAEKSTSEWSNFRNSDVNMAITTAKTPKSGNETVEKWAVSMGTGWTDAPSVQIIVDDCLVVMSNTKIKKLSLKDGSLVKEGTMDGKSAYTYVSPTYADGMIYCALSGGKVQAFDAETLESKWIYEDELGGQDQSPITYHDGYVYTGFYVGEEKAANYVCVDAKTGEKVWTKENIGGFYWAGAVVVGNALIVGGADGQKGCNGKAPLYALNRLTGEEISKLDASGDINSSMAYADGRVYFVTKQGKLCSAAVDSKTGALSDLKEKEFSSKGGTSTPVVYKGYVYLGADDSTFKVAKADTLEVVQSVSLKGPSKSSWLLSTAYEESEGSLYFYGTYNEKPGGVSMVKVDAKDPTKCELTELFVPTESEKQQYCICSLICDSEGNLYYKNDSKHVFALTTNQAYLEDLVPNIGKWTTPFSASLHELELIVPIGTERVTFAAKAVNGSKVTVNGDTAATPVALKNGSATAVIKVVNGEDSRTYTVNIREMSADASLETMKVSNSNSVADTTKDRIMTPEFSPETLYYGVYDVPEEKSFVNLWPKAADENASVKVYAISNVAEGRFEADTKEIGVTATNGTRSRYALYFDDSSKPMAVKVVVTAEDGETQKTYHMVVSAKAAAKDAEEMLEKLKNADVKPVASAKINVTISDKGNVMVALKSVLVEDRNKDGILNVDEALYAVHQAAYNGGAEAGYASAVTEYGNMITKLWGDTSGAYGYWLNNASCMGLDDTVKAGDHLVAFIYKDAELWSDIYTAFEKTTYTTSDSMVKVSLKQAGYDDNWNTVFSSLSGAKIRVYDENLNLIETGYQITELGDGKYGVAFAKAGNYILIGTAEETNTVPAVCSVTCEKGYESQEKEDGGSTMIPDNNHGVTGTVKTGDDTPIVFYAAVLLMAGVTAGWVTRRRKMK